MKIELRVLTATAAIAGAAPAYADGNTANLDQTVGQAYNDFQQHCTRTMAPYFQRIVWNNPLPAKVGQGPSSTPTELSVVRSRCRGARTTAALRTRKGSFQRSPRVTGTSPSSSAEKKGHDEDTAHPGGG
jgi:hypothetical protein